MAAGGLLVWSGVKGASVTTALRDFLSGTKPTGTNVNPIGTPAAAAAGG